MPKAAKTAKTAKTAKPSPCPPPRELRKAVILRRMCEGESLRSICLTKGFPKPSTVMDWVKDDAVFAEQYARAQDARAEVYFDRLDGVSDMASSPGNVVDVAGLRLKADNIKWQLARMAPKRFGDRLAVTGENGGPVAVAHTFDASGLSTGALAEIIAARDADAANRS